MIKALVTALVLLVGVGASALYYRSTLPDPAVSHVLSQCAEAKERFSFTSKNGRRTVRVVPYAAAIRKIDPSACPKEFEAAWSNYCNAWGERATRQKAKTEFLMEVVVDAAEMYGTMGAATGTVIAKEATKKIAKTAVNSAMKERQHPPVDTHFEWSEVKKCAVICNCKMTENIDDF